MDRPDLAWKLLLPRRLQAALAILFPEVHALVDWSQQYYLPDKSLLPATSDSCTGERDPDFVALVTLLDDSEACIHVEIQCTRQAGFAERMALYHARLRDRFARPVFSLAILGDSSPTWRPACVTDLRIGCGTIFQFRSVKLLDYRDSRAVPPQPGAPVAMALKTHLIALDTRRRAESRYQAKLALLRSIHERRVKNTELNELQKIIDWMLPLPADRQRRLIMDIDDFILEHEKEDKNSLNYMLPKLILERHKKLAEAEGRAKGEAEGWAKGAAEGWAKGEAEGKAEGKAEGEALGLAAGQRQMLKLQLAIQFGRVSATLERTLQRADSTQLERLAIALLDAESLEGALQAAGL